MENNNKKQHIALTPQEKSAMTKPYSYMPCPRTVQLIPGKQYQYCTCGLTETQPFCDDSHQGTKFQPIRFIANQAKNTVICLCRRNNPKSGPYCDGSHNDPKTQW